MNKEIKKCIIFCLLGLTAWSSMAVGATQVLTLTENKRLEANIASDVMNRLTVTQDRIINVFGDEGTFVTQTDEHTGQIFIKPTTENANNPLSITLITENGLTQDLTLNPIEGKAATIILKSSEINRQSKSPQEALLPGFSRGAEIEQELWIATLRQAVLGELPELEGKYPVKEPHVSGFEIKHQKTYQTGALVVKVFKLKNTSGFPQEIAEKDFYQLGDIAISLQKKSLEMGEKTEIYVLGAA